ncbi:hypothetical protein EV702DRAFT_1048164 [Suillus placidus]|uniref:Uncharacterized protein n=1 Tax=Suillus placidus TaxID=48579 RepID=A0A9P6ZQ91_9AGAM|nr:hypothetical protein EV702DRAFT_1048164 [Suillus placidus]
MLYLLPEYMPLILDKVQWKTNEVQRTFETRGSQAEIRTGELEQRLRQEEGNRDWDRRRGTEIGTGGGEQRLGQEEGNRDWDRRRGTEIGTGGAERRLGQEEQSGD